jgi:hypothetical protein
MNQVQIDQLLCVSKTHARQKRFLPFDDYVFHLVIKKGPTVSKIGCPVFTEVYDLAEATQDHQRHVFKMSILDASTLSEQWPLFETTGLVGSFKFQSSSGLLKAIKIFEDTDISRIWSFLLDASSHVFVRSRYEQIHQQKQNDGSDSVEESTSVVQRVS